jgi:hypothetical protein
MVSRYLSNWRYSNASQNLRQNLMSSSPEVWSLVYIPISALSGRLVPAGAGVRVWIAKQWYIYYMITSSLPLTAGKDPDDLFNLQWQMIWIYLKSWRWFWHQYKLKYDDVSRLGVHHALCRPAGRTALWSGGCTRLRIVRRVSSTGLPLSEEHVAPVLISTTAHQGTACRCAVSLVHNSHATHKMSLVTIYQSQTLHHSPLL